VIVGAQCGHAFVIRASLVVRLRARTPLLLGRRRLFCR
jgi:hypothetical protein